MGNQAQANSPTKTNKDSLNQSNPNKNNQIPDMASNNVIVPPEEAEKRQLGLSQLANKFVASVESKKASQSKVNIDPSRLLITNLRGDKRYSLESQVVSVPFDVILATMDTQLLETFDKLGTKLKQYYTKEEKGDQQWKLHGNGFYINYELGHEVVIITNNIIYKGVVVTNKQQKIVPDEFGMLINKLGMYTGEFKNGKANGQGTYIDKNTMSEFKGRWQDGHIVDGMIVNSQYEFKGTFAEAINVGRTNNDERLINEEVKFKANGEGAIRFKKTGASYIGNFVDGQYETLQREIARYKTQAYEYSGHFMKGKKEGEGILVEFPKSNKSDKNIPKPNITANKKKKFRPTDKYDGVWQDDYFITTRNDRQKKKIRDIMLKAELENKIMQGSGPFNGFNDLGRKQNLKMNPKMLEHDKLSTQKPMSSTKSDAQMFEIAEQQNIQSEI